MKNKKAIYRGKLIAAPILLSLSSGIYAAEVSMKGGVISTVNGVKVVDINKANNKGISHNLYDKLNVDKGGLIFNNSQNGANTQLAGQVNANSNLASGTAKVILNEVISKNQSMLNGVMEIAGDKAHLIIANPNGINCQSCGFINAEKVTVTTGKPDMIGGELKGYSVNGGNLSVNYLESTSPTEILARSVVVNGKVYAGELSVVAGNNYINANGQVTGSVVAQGGRNGYSVDVARIGGMYANKINLVSTENGVGVRNNGVIAAGALGLQIDSKGQLINDNAQMKSNGMLGIKTNGSLENATGQLVADGAIYIDTNKNAVKNTRAGKIASAESIYASTGGFENINGKVSAGQVVAINTNGNTLTNYGKGPTVGIEAGVVTLSTGALNNNNGQISGNYIGANATGIYNTNGIIDTASNIDLVSKGEVKNNSGRIRSASGKINIDAATTVTNSYTKTADAASADSLGIISGGEVKISSGRWVDNSNGHIAAESNVFINSKEGVYNNDGKVVSNQQVFVDAASLNNRQAGLSGKKGTVVNVTGNIDNYIGVISSDEGDVNLKANAVSNYGGFIMANDVNITTQTWLDNRYAFMLANRNLTIEAKGDVNNYAAGNDFGRYYGIYFGMPQQKGGMIGKEGVKITANNIQNDYSRIVSENGAMTLSANTLYNHSAQIVSGVGDSSIKARDIYNNYSTIYSAGNLSINTGSLSILSSGSIINNNATGIISADQNLRLNVAGNFTNYGWISSKGNNDVGVAGVLYNRNTISAESNLNVSAKSAVYNYRDIAAGSILNVMSEGYIGNENNTSNMVGQNVNVIAGGYVNNRGNIASDWLLTLYSKGDIYNYNTIFSDGYANISANNVYNNGVNSILGGRYGTVLNVNRVSGNGTVIGL